MGAKSFYSATFQYHLAASYDFDHAVRMELAKQPAKKRDALAPVALADLLTRKGTEVSVNARPADANGEARGAFIGVAHAPQRLAKRLTKSTAEKPVLRLLDRREVCPQAVMKSNENETNWHTQVPRTNPTATAGPVTLRVIR